MLNGGNGSRSAVNEFGVGQLDLDIHQIPRISSVSPGFQQFLHGNVNIALGG